LEFDLDMGCLVRKTDACINDGSTRFVVSASREYKIGSKL